MLAILISPDSRLHLLNSGCLLDLSRISFPEPQHGNTQVCFFSFTAHDSMLSNAQCLEKTVVSHILSRFNGHFMQESKFSPYYSIWLKVEVSNSQDLF